MISGYVEYKNMRLMAEEEIKSGRANDETIQDLHLIEEFETEYPSVMDRFEKEKVS